MSRQLTNIERLRNIQRGVDDYQMITKCVDCFPPPEALHPRECQYLLYLTVFQLLTSCHGSPDYIG